MTHRLSTQKFLSHFHGIFPKNLRYSALKLCHFDSTWKIVQSSSYPNPKNTLKFLKTKDQSPYFQSFQSFLKNFCRIQFILT